MYPVLRSGWNARALSDVVSVRGKEGVGSNGAGVKLGLFGSRSSVPNPPTRFPSAFVRETEKLPPGLLPRTFAGRFSPSRMNDRDQPARKTLLPESPRRNFSTPLSGASGLQTIPKDGAKLFMSAL